jgi:2-polyprenyl-3-methyl-5-hydroxy-6-metoxy-1,4-benzoquinol methylase
MKHDAARIRNARGDLRAAIERQYAKRAEDDWIYSPWTPHYLPIREDTERNLHACLQLFCRRRGITRANWKSEVEKLAVLDVGCGQGWVLSYLISLGFLPANLRGIELLERSVQRARATLPAATKVTAENLLDHAGTGYDLVLFFTVFSSVLKPEQREALASAAVANLRPGGAIVIFDFAFDNPRNRDVKRVTDAEIRRYFPQRDVVRRSAYLAPPISRLICKLSPKLYSMLNVPFLRSHRFWLVLDEPPRPAAWARGASR